MRRNQLPHLLPGPCNYATVVAYIYASMYYCGKGYAMAGDCTRLCSKRQRTPKRISKGERTFCIACVNGVFTCSMASQVLN